MENRKAKILAIDDNGDNLITLKALIMDAFSETVVLTALRGQEGLDLAAAEDPDVILLDIIMPGMDGFEVCTKLKTDKRLRDIPVVFVTAVKGDKENRVKALDCGAEAFLSKPIDSIELTAQVRAMLKIRAANIQKRDEKELLAALVKEKTRELEESNENTLQLMEDLKKEQTLIRSIFDSIPGYLYVYDERGRLIKWNKKHETMTGFSADELSHMTLEKWFDQEDLLKVSAAVHDVFEKGYGEVEAHLILKNGEKMFTRSSGAPLILDGHKYFTGIGVDITERKKAESDFFWVMKQNQRILDNLQDAYFQTDLSGNFTVVNPKSVHMYGYSTESELIGQSATMLYADPDIRVRVTEVLNKDGEIVDLVTKGLRKDGTTFWVSMNVQFVKDEQDRVTGTEGLVRDISERTTMISEIEQQRDHLIVSNVKLAYLLEQSVKSISKIGELRDAYTAGHQRRVQDLSCAIAKQLGLSDNAIVNLSYGALIHDIGKIYIPSEILNKPGKISSLEFQIIQTHVEHGYNVVKEIDFPDVIPDMVYQHHERLDGTGYPQGLSGEQIIIESRILAVSDVVEAMTSHRPYRPALGIDAALEEITKHRGQLYDCEVVDACVQIIRGKGFSFSELLSDSF